MRKNKKNKAPWIKKDFSRRRFLQGALEGVGYSIALPYFDCMLTNNGNALAATGDPLPLRFGTFFWGLGYGLDINHWIPNGAGSQWSIPVSGHGLSGLTAHKEYLTVFSNYSHPNAPGAGHIPQRGISVSASHNPNWVFDNTAPGYRRQNMPLPSIDALIHENWQNTLDTPHSYINMTPRLGNLYTGTSSWARGGNYRLFSRTPAEVYDRIFRPIAGNTPPQGGDNPTLSDITYQFRKSVLDASLGDLNSLAMSLNPSDKLRLDAHISGVRDFERRISDLHELEPDDNDVSCNDVAQPQNYPSENELSLRHAIMADMLVYALSCNLTRLFCYEFTSTQSGGRIPEIGLTSSEGIHAGYSHGDTAAMRNYLSYTMNSLGILAGKLKAVQEGSGNLLDQMLLLGTSEYAGPHHHNGHPYLFLGKAGGNLKGNYHSKLGGTNNSDASRILLTAAHAVGVNLPKLGMPATPTTGDSGRPANTHNYEATTAINEVLIP